MSGDHGGDSTIAVSVSWGTRDIEMIRRHYARRVYAIYRLVCKRKIHTHGTALPPGWQKKVEPFPASLERECAPLPAGYRRGVIDAHAVIYDSRGTIIDVVVLFSETEHRRQPSGPGSFRGRRIFLATRRG